MDEITYWIFTKRAPCLMGYDNLMKKPLDVAHCSKEEIRPVTEDVPSPKKRKKRKLSVLDDESVSTEKQQNVYFEVSQNRSKPAGDSCNSDSVGSDVDFNIKNTSVQCKKKKTKLQKNSRAVLHKKNKVVTSTPKSTVHLRRSLRQQQLGNSVLNTSIDMYNISAVNGFAKNKTNTSLTLVNHESYANGELPDNKNNLKPGTKYTTLQNGDYEDMSDVSGFTATYIRSTKVQSNKTPKKLRSKNLKHLQSPPNSSNMVVCINKHTNTADHSTNVLNCSTDSSQNVINLVTIKPNAKTEQTNKTTSPLRFMDCKKSRQSISKTIKHKKANLNTSFQSQSSRNSRYPKRNTRNNTNTVDNVTENSPRKQHAEKNCLEFNNSDKKENPDDKLVTRTRSGRIPGLTVCHRENSVLVVSNSTEQVGSMVSMNVASPNLKKKRKTRQVRCKTSPNKSLKKDSLRDKSGFAQCFSESDDSEPLVQRKYFCA